MADKDNVLKGFVTRPVQMRLGSHIFKERLYVAPISDEMLLGHDIMHRLGVLHDMPADLFIKMMRIFPFRQISCCLGTTSCIV